MTEIPTLLQLLVFLLLGVSAVVYLWSKVRRESHMETRELADTRGDRIDDLEDEVRELKGKVEHLEGAMEAIQRLKASEIAVEVARLLEPRLPRRADGGG